MIGKMLARLSGRGNRQGDLDPEMPFVAIGDIHGRLDLLKVFLDRTPTEQIVLVGDYVDRGDDSAGVLRLLSAREDLICLSGNHEELMLNFIKSPERHGARWLRYGGLQTLASYGVSGMTETSANDAMVKARDQLLDAMGPETLAWLKSRPTSWQSGNIAVVHAGADPNVPIYDQSVKTLHWGHGDFLKKRRRDGVWVIHGHTIVDAPQNTKGRIAIDTGAYATGRLSAVHIDQTGARFETVTLNA